MPEGQISRAGPPFRKYLATGHTVQPVTSAPRGLLKPSRQDEESPAQKEFFADSLRAAWLLIFPLLIKGRGDGCVLLPAGEIVVCATHRISGPRWCAGRCTKNWRHSTVLFASASKRASDTLRPHRSRHADVSKSRHTSSSGGSELHGRSRKSLGYSVQFKPYFLPRPRPPARRCRRARFAPSGTTGVHSPRA